MGRPTTTNVVPPPPGAVAAEGGGAAAVDFSGVPPAQPASQLPSLGSPIVAVLVRFFTFACALISLIILASNTTQVTVTLFDLDTSVLVPVHFNDFYAYRYMLAASIIGAVYSLLQLGLTIYHIATGNRVGGQKLYLWDFYGDMVVSYIMGTGAAAGFGATLDIRGGRNDSLNEFFNKANAAASILLIGFLFVAVSSVMSSLALPRKGN